MNDYSSKHINDSPDPVSAQELLLFIENDADLYRQLHTPIIQILVAKKARGNYKSDLAAKLFGYLVESGAKKYYKEFGSGGLGWSGMFPKKVRDAVAAELRDSFEVEYGLGNYDQYIPKKYLPKAPKAAYKVAKKGRSKSRSTSPSLGSMR
jgi:hypothetical protein